MSKKIAGQRSEKREARSREDVWCGELICVIKNEGRAELCGVYRLQHSKT